MCDIGQGRVLTGVLDSTREKFSWMAVPSIRPHTAGRVVPQQCSAGVALKGAKGAAMRRTEVCQKRHAYAAMREFRSAAQCWRFAHRRRPRALSTGRQMSRAVSSMRVRAIRATRNMLHPWSETARHATLFASIAESLQGALSAGPDPLRIGSLSSSSGG